MRALILPDEPRLVSRPSRRQKQLSSVKAARTTQRRNVATVARVYRTAVRPSEHKKQHTSAQAGSGAFRNKIRKEIIDVDVVT